jgi:hypothetical protein
MISIVSEIIGMAETANEILGFNLKDCIIPVNIENPW